ncbi:hypothetical protein AAFF_G00332050, partial [Aldrovandia affinis]
WVCVIGLYDPRPRLAKKERKKKKKTHTYTRITYLSIGKRIEEHNLKPSRSLVIGDVYHFKKTNIDQLFSSSAL